MLLEIGIIALLVVINGLFSGAEIATVTLRKTRLEQLLAEGKRGARAVTELRRNPERFLATVQVGITVVGVAAAAYGGETLALRLAGQLASVPAVAPYAQPMAFVIVVTLLSFFSLVLGELVPKSLALRASERYALLVGRPLLSLAQIARPIVWLLTTSSNTVLKLFGDRTSFTEARVSPDELKALLEEAGEEGQLHPGASEIATRAIELAELSARDVMIPRSEMQALDKSATLGELRQALIDRRHSRIVLYDATIDNVVGFVAVHDAFVHGGAPDEPLEAIMRPIGFVPEQMRAVDVLPKLQTDGAELAVVVDEHGGTAGLITRIDVAEELFGVSGPGATAQSLGIRKDPDGSATLPATAPIREVNRALDLELPDSDDFATIGGLVVALAGKIPGKGDRVVVENGATLEVIEASPRRVRVVRIVPRPHT